MSDPKTGAKLTLSGWVVDCDEIRQDAPLGKPQPPTRSARRVDCADCHAPLPDTCTDEWTYYLVPEHVDRCCDCTDRILGA